MNSDTNKHTPPKPLKESEGFRKGMGKTETPIEATDVIINHDTFISGQGLIVKPVRNVWSGDMITWDYLADNVGFRSWD